MSALPVRSCVVAQPAPLQLRVERIDAEGEVLDAIDGWGWQDGLRPGDEHMVRIGKGVALILGIYESAKTGAEVPLPLP
mgnify:CR=1 FL=1